jgi:hypothetical protein
MFGDLAELSRRKEMISKEYESACFLFPKEFLDKEAI